jgi:hypothetical protein
MESVRLRASRPGAARLALAVSPAHPHPLLPTHPRATTLPLRSIVFQEES